MARNKYLNNRDLLLEIHKSKKKYSSYIADEDSDFDVIVPELKKINIRSIAEARRNKVKKLEKMYDGKEIPLPDYWGGYILEHRNVEFWQGRRDRLHDRFVYTKHGRIWQIERLAP